MLVHEFRLFYRTGQQEVGRSRTKVESKESIAHKWQSSRARRTNLVLKPWADITRCPKRGYQWRHKKDLYPPKYLEKLLYRILTTPDEDISRHNSGVRPMEASAGSSTAMIDWLTRPDRWVRTVFRCRQWASPKIVMLKVTWMKKSRAGLKFEKRKNSRFLALFVKCIVVLEVMNLHP